MEHIEEILNKDEEEENNDKESYMMDSESKEKQERRSKSKGKKPSGREKERADFEEDNKKKQNSSSNDQFKNETKASLSIQVLMKAIETDKECFKKGIPALEKLRTIPYLSQILKTIEVATFFLNMNGLNLLEEFLKKNPDGSTPCYNQIEKILDIISLLNISKEHLEDSNILDVLSGLAKLKLPVHLENKSKIIFSKLQRLSSGLYNNKVDINKENEAYTKFLNKKKIKAKYEDGGNMNSKIFYEKINSERRIPMKALFDFTLKPEKMDIKPDDPNRNSLYMQNSRRFNDNYLRLNEEH